MDEQFVEVTLNGNLYRGVLNENGELVSIKRFNIKVGLWVKINFAAATEEVGRISEMVTEMLSSEFLRSIQ